MGWVSFNEDNMERFNNGLSKFENRVNEAMSKNECSNCSLLAEAKRYIEIAIRLREDMEKYSDIATNPELDLAHDNEILNFTISKNAQKIDELNAELEKKEKYCIDLTSDFTEKYKAIKNELTNTNEQLMTELRHKSAIENTLKKELTLMADKIKQIYINYSDEFPEQLTDYLDEFIKRYAGSIGS